MKKSFKNAFNNFKPRKTLEATVDHLQPLEIKPRLSQAGGGKPRLMNKSSAASSTKTSRGSQIQNIGFPLRTPGFQFNPLFISNFVDEGIYTYNYISTRKSVNKTRYPSHLRRKWRATVSSPRSFGIKSWTA